MKCKRWETIVKDMDAKSVFHLLMKLQSQPEPVSESDFNNWKSGIVACLNRLIEIEKVKNN